MTWLLITSVSCAKNSVYLEMLTLQFILLSSENKYHSLPLFGHFCCRLAVQPECINKDVCIGNVKIDGQDYWARLQGFCIKTWESKKHAEEGQNPEHTVSVNKVGIFVNTYVNPLHNCFIINLNNSHSICREQRFNRPKLPAKNF